MSSFLTHRTQNGCCACSILRRQKRLPHHMLCCEFVTRLLEYRFNCRPIDDADKCYLPDGMYYSNKLAVQCDFREIDNRPIILGYTLDLGHTLLGPLLSSAYDNRVLSCIARNSILQNAERGMQNSNHV